MTSENATPRPAEIIPVHDRVAACDGGGGAMGHPRVFLRLQGRARDVECPYCSRLFVLQGDDAGTGH